MERESCYVKNCGVKPTYVIEWYGLNQHMENPEIADERNVCDNFEHILSASYHNGFGGFPDGVVDVITLQVEYPSLVEKIIGVMKQKNDN
jgi:hypothetical protein